MFNSPPLIKTRDKVTLSPRKAQRGRSVGNSIMKFLIDVLFGCFKRYLFNTSKFHESNWSQCPLYFFNREG